MHWLNVSPALTVLELLSNQLQRKKSESLAAKWFTELLLTFSVWHLLLGWMETEPITLINQSCEIKPIKKERWKKDAKMLW